MDPCELNALVASVSNALYSSLPRGQFFCLAVFLNELSKSMLAMPLFDDLCGHKGKFS
jgi:hypothetical protein